MDGNLLLNVGPNAAGEIEPEQVKRLKEMGPWLKINGESIYGTRGGPIDYNANWGGSTKKNNFIYLHVTNWPENGNLEIPYSGKKIIKAHFLASGDKVRFSQNSNSIAVTKPKSGADEIDTVIKLQMK
jgi:alpha-L-fucosidase